MPRLFAKSALFLATLASPVAIESARAGLNPFEPYQPVERRQPANPPSARPQPAYVAPAADDQTPAGGVTDAQLGAVLRNMGCDPKPLAGNDGATVWVVKLSRDNWSYTFNVALSPNHQYVWYSHALTAIRDPEKVSPAAMVKLLEWNSKSTTTFAFNPQNDNRLTLSRPLPNHDLSAAKVRAEMETFLTAVRESEPLWNEKALTTKSRDEFPEW